LDLALAKAFLALLKLYIRAWADISISQRKTLRCNIITKGINLNMSGIVKKLKEMKALGVGKDNEQLIRVNLILWIININQFI
jgi:hypothetical protein